MFYWLPEMRLTSFTDYALRLLMMVHENPQRLVTIKEIADRYRISRANLMKVANELTSAGFLTGVRGRSGGLRLARPASEIRIGDVVRTMEPDFALVECFEARHDCVVASLCKLPRALQNAQKAFLSELDGVSLEDVALRPANVSGPRPPQASPPTAP